MSCPRALAIYGTIARFLDRKEVAGLHTHKASRAGFARAPTSCFAGSNPISRGSLRAASNRRAGNLSTSQASVIACQKRRRELPLRPSSFGQTQPSRGRLAQTLLVLGRTGNSWALWVCKVSTGSWRRLAAVAGKDVFHGKVRNAYGSTVVPCALHQRLDASNNLDVGGNDWVVCDSPMEVCIHRPSRRRSLYQPKPTNCVRALQPASAGRLARSEHRLARRAAAPLGEKR